MKSALVEITAGWTGLLGPFTLKLDGVPFDLTGFTVALTLYKESGTALTPGGTVNVLNQTTNRGQVTYQPAVGDFTLEPNRHGLVQYYSLKWKVTDVQLKVVDFPNGEPERVAVWR